MNVWQMTRQLKYLSAAAVWPGSAVKVFKAVVISVRPNEEVQSKFRFPLLAIRPLGSEADPNQSENPKLLKQSYAMRVFVGDSGDGVGEASIIGSHRTGGEDSSLGKGLLEVEEQLIDAIGQATGADGAKILNTFRSSVDVLGDEDRPHITIRDYLFEALVGNARFYHPGTRLTGTDQGGGSALLTWKLPPGRFDFVRMRLRRAAGATPPATPTSGVDVALADPVNDVSVVDSPGAGTFSYSLFAMYDDLNNVPVSELKFSAADTVSSLVVT